MTEHCYRALLPSIATQQWHVRTYERTHGEQWSPGRDNTSFVTRGHAYGELS